MYFFISSPFIHSHKILCVVWNQDKEGRDNSNMAEARFPKPLYPTLWDGYICPKAISACLLQAKECTRGPPFKNMPKGWGWPMRQEVELCPWFFFYSKWGANELNSIFAMAHLSPADSKHPLIIARTLPFTKIQHLLYFYSIFYFGVERKKKSPHHTHREKGNKQPAPVPSFE